MRGELVKQRALDKSIQTLPKLLCSSRPFEQPRFTSLLYLCVGVYEEASLDQRSFVVVVVTAVVGVVGTGAASPEQPATTTARAMTNVVDRRRSCRMVHLPRSAERAVPLPRYQLAEGERGTPGPPSVCTQLPAPGPNDEQKRIPHPPLEGSDALDRRPGPRCVGGVPLIQIEDHRRRHRDPAEGPSYRRAGKASTDTSGSDHQRRELPWERPHQVS